MLIAFIFLFLAGLLGGYLAGLIGIGGGIIYITVIPYALLMFGFPAQEITQYTIANSIAAIFFASLASTLTLIKSNRFYWRPVLVMAVASSITSLLVLNYVVNTPWYDAFKFTVVVLVLMIYLIINTIWIAKKNYDYPLESIHFGKYFFVGISSGVVTAISGLGGGIIIIPLLNSLFKVDIKKAGSISLGVIMFTSFSMTIFNLFEDPRINYTYYSMGYIVFPIGFLLAAGVAIAAPFGVKSANKMESKKISYIYAGIITIIILKKIADLF